MIEPIITFLTMIGAMGVILLIGSWVIHRKMTVENGVEWDYATFKLFKKHFQQVQWTRGGYDNGFPSSFFDYTTKPCSQIHASIVSFEGKGLVFYPWSYPRFLLYMRGLKIPRRKKGIFLDEHKN